jgi:hypothetical protein
MLRGDEAVDEPELLDEQSESLPLSLSPFISTLSRCLGGARAYSEAP